MKIIVDTNIVFSAILNVNSRIGRLLIQAPPSIAFYSCDFLVYEIRKHKDKLLKITKLSKNELWELQQLVTQKIHFINDDLLNDDLLDYAENLLQDIDIDDAPFVTLAMQLEGKLWTGDKKLSEGLAKKGFQNLISTEKLLELMNEL